MPDSIDLTPDLASLRRTFAHDARSRAGAIIAGLDELREFHSLLIGLNMVAHCVTSLRELEALQDLMHEATMTVAAKVSELEARGPA